ncbi:hypothetical protein H696_04676 [Fonticula alba]|uniref:Uncharacterized protein n=1 Tax=Fonticula alba TaxID=691883 RepID=A0A058Z5N0_FONAL|nr:hypothetical protein H696_04676 [Fonticula alba]KCV69248.1 hypothetical protein H696_04676 [Fonticula alba]|eukprot:XP_009496819.1 hypothetical protein H696_04676 [Fonticula alba]
MSTQPEGRAPKVPGSRTGAACHFGECMPPAEEARAGRGGTVLGLTLRQVTPTQLEGLRGAHVSDAEAGALGHAGEGRAREENRDLVFEATRDWMPATGGRGRHRGR